MRASLVDVGAVVIGVLDLYSPNNACEEGRG